MILRLESDDAGETWAIEFPPDLLTIDDFKTLLQAAKISLSQHRVGGIAESILGSLDHYLDGQQKEPVVSPKISAIIKESLKITEGIAKALEHYGNHTHTNEPGLVSLPPEDIKLRASAVRALQDLTKLQKRLE